MTALKKFKIQEIVKLLNVQNQCGISLFYYKI